MKAVTAASFFYQTRKRSPYGSKTLSKEFETGGFRHYVMGFVPLPLFSWMIRSSKSFDGSSAELGPRDLGPVVTLFHTFKSQK